MVESFFATLKTEVFHGHPDLTLEQARTEIFAYLEGFYNRVLRHSTLGYLSLRSLNSGLCTQTPVSTKPEEVQGLRETRILAGAGWNKLE
jgi:transposase InsO family protein